MKNFAIFEWPMSVVDKVFFAKKREEEERRKGMILAIVLGSIALALVGIVVAAVIIYKKCEEDKGIKLVIKNAKNKFKKKSVDDILDESFVEDEAVDAEVSFEEVAVEAE